MNSQYEEKLGTESLLPLIMKMALPAVAAQIVNLLYSIVDRIYIGHIDKIGKDALAGIGVTGSVIILISAFSQIVASGGAPLASISLGRDDRKKAEKYLGNGFLLLFIFTVITSVLTYIFMTPLLMVTGASQNTIVYAKDYLKIYLIGTLFVQIATGLNTFINAQGRPSIAMISVLIGAVLNIILDPIFIYSFKMGVKGAALATIISQCASAIFVLRFLFSNKATLRLKFEMMKPDKKILGSMLALGIAPFVMASTESLIGFVLNGSLAKYGDIYVSALTIMQSALQIASVPLTGFAQGFSPIISYNYGHSNAKRVKDCFKIVLSIMFLFNFVLIILMMIFPSLISSMFTNNTELISVASKCMPTFICGMSIFGLQRACQTTFVALGESKISLFIALLRKVILLIPLALILSKFMGYMGVYRAEAIADATAAIICITIFIFRFPKILKKIES